jgi:hypothetical protein
MTDPRIEKLGLPELMLQLDHPENALHLWGGEEGLETIQPDAPPEDILRVEAMVDEEGDQYIFTWRSSALDSWTTPEWSEHSDPVRAGMPVTGLQEVLDGVGALSAPEDLHPALRGVSVKMRLPFRVVRLSTLPREEWVGKTALRPVGERGGEPIWNTDDLEYRDRVGWPNSLALSLGIVFEALPDGGSVGGYRCRLLTERGVMVSSPHALWVPVQAPGSGR